MANNTNTKKKTSETKKTTPKKSTAKKSTTKKSSKTAVAQNVDYYEIKLLILIAFTVLSIFSLHTSLVGVVGAFIQHIYFGLFSFGGYALPYIILIGGFYKINNRLIPYRTKTIVGLGILFLSILLMVNLLNIDILNNEHLAGGSLLSFDSIKTLYGDGVELHGSGLLGTLIGALFIKLIGKIGLYIAIFTLWLVAFILVTNVKLTVWFKKQYELMKVKRLHKKEVKAHAKEEYIKGSEKLEQQRIKEEEKIRLQKETSLEKEKQEQLNKALEKVDLRLKAEEKEHQKKLEEFDAMFTQSPTRSIVDKLLKKSEVPSADELKLRREAQLKAHQENEHIESRFQQFEEDGYIFDEEFQNKEIIKKSPDIFDNYQPSTIDPNENIKITGFGTLIEDSIKKAYHDSHMDMPNFDVPMDHEFDIKDQMDFNEELVPEEEIISSFDEAFMRAESEHPTPIAFEDDIFEKGTPMSAEEKANVDKFNQLTKGASTSKSEESHIPDQQIVNHMSERVKLEFENYRVPSISILKKNTTANTENKAELYEKANRLEEILNNFKIDASVIQITKGPAITRYELELKPGTKMSKITNLSDDIALNLATQQVRIAAVPGKAAVGIEVPNDTTSLVSLREVLDSKEFSSSTGKLSVGLGKNIAGKPIIADLAKMPHTLIAGATGSGKSVCVNTIITSILLNAKPDEVKFLMIDPKVVELNNYNGIPHLILPVVTDPKKASVALNWAVQEMTRRYSEFAESGVRDIKGYNARFEFDKERFMPQIVVIIDELADLMMVAPNQVEDAICRLAQMARAAGIHLIVATQRPSVDVITGVIKANIPSRIAFSVSSAIDSRTIIDMSGAEKLLGKGDMLYYPSGSSKPQRVQGAFIGDDEVEAVVSAVKNQFDAFTYDEDLLDNVSSNVPTNESIDGETDEYMAAAIELVVDMEQASISMLQRKFKIGYNRAARLIDEMEERGVVGPSQGSKPRTVLINRSDLL